MKYILEDQKFPRSDRLRAALSAVLLVATGFNPSSLRAEEIKIGGTGSAVSTMRLLANEFNKSQSETKIIFEPGLGGSGGIRAVLSGIIHIAVSGRAPRDSEISQGAIALEYGRTPLAFVTHASSKTAALTTRELVEIYSGRMNNWQDGTRLRLVMRAASDSDTEAIRAISPEVRQANIEALARPGMLVAVSDNDNVTHIEKIPGALGTTALSMIFSEGLPLKALKLNGVEPTAKNIANGSYPYFKRMYIITGPKINPAAHKFIAFVQSPAGREILARTEHWVTETKVRP